jgi:hypothetical protein
MDKTIVAAVILSRLLTLCGVALALFADSGVSVVLGLGVIVLGAIYLVVALRGRSTGDPGD